MGHVLPKKVFMRGQTFLGICIHGKSRVLYGVTSGQSMWRGEFYKCNFHHTCEENFFNCYLVIPQTNLGYSWGNSLTNLMLITVFSKCLVGLEMGAFWFLLQHLNPRPRFHPHHINQWSNCYCIMLRVGKTQELLNHKIMLKALSFFEIFTFLVWLFAYVKKRLFLFNCYLADPGPTLGH